jgi:hypothetical protein
MNIDDQLAAILAHLGVEVETPQDGQELEVDAPIATEMAIFQSSRNHYGTFYRLDLVEGSPHLRVLIPTDHGKTKVELYLVRLLTDTSDTHMFGTLVSAFFAYQGSEAFERVRESVEQQMLQAVGEIMKHLFWNGDLAELTFPSEIHVTRLL